MVNPVIREITCPYCKISCAGKRGITDHVLIAHPREAIRVAIKQRDEEWERLLFNPSYLVAWNVVAPKGSEILIKSAYVQVVKEHPEFDGLELSKAIVNLVPGSRVGPCAGELL